MSENTNGGRGSFAYMGRTARFVSERQLSPAEYIGDKSTAAHVTISL